MYFTDYTLTENLYFIRKNLKIFLINFELILDFYERCKISARFTRIILVCLYILGGAAGQVCITTCKVIIKRDGGLSCYLPLPQLVKLNTWVETMIGDRV